MSAQVYTTGAASLVALVLPLALAAVRLRARLLPPMSSATARLAEVIFALTLLIVVSELVGSVGWFRRWPLLIGCWAVAGLCMLVTGRRRVAPRIACAPVPRLGGGAAAVGVGIVLFAFGVGTFAALHGANWDIDSVGYHLPESARFFQSHRLTGIQFTSVDPAPAYYPANSELIHAVGMLLFQRDLLTVWINLGFAALGLLAGWCLGETLSCPPATLLAVGTLAVTPQIAQGGTALNDGVGLSLMMAAAALGLSPRGGRVHAVGALAGGLALGTKLNLLVPVVGLAVAAVVLTSRPQRLRAALSWLVGIVAGGGFWFARNLAHTGSPLPLLNLGPLPHVNLLPGESTNLVQALRAGTLSVHQMTSALNAGLGRTWPVVLLAALAGLVLALWRGTPSQRALGLVAVVALVSFAFTPLTGSQFLWTVRYAGPALALGLALVATVPVRRYPDWGRRWAPLGLLALLAATVSPPRGSHAGAVLLGVVATLVAAAAMGIIPRPRALAPQRRIVLAAVAVLVAALLIAGYPVSRSYVRHRFSAVPSATPSSVALVELARFGRTVSRARFAVVGMELQYQLAGPELSNYVQYLGRSGGSGNWSEITSCTQWRRAVDAGGFNYVVTAPTFWPTLEASISPAAPVPAAAWTARDPSARPVLRPYPTVTVFQLRGRLSAAGCARSVGAGHHEPR